MIRMRSLLFISLAVLALSCAQATRPPASSTAQNNAPPPSSATPTPEQTKRLPDKPITMPPVQAVTDGEVFRTSDRKDQYGIYQPPWKEIVIANVGSKKELAINAEVTVVPVGVDLAPFKLKVKETKRGSVCAKGEPPWWEVELEPITQQQFFDIRALPGRSEEYPFDVGVIYPAVEFALALPKEQLTQEMLPVGIYAETLTAAIDLTNDKKPDVLIAEFCCREPAKKFPDCDYTCGKTYLKVKDKWKLVDESSPC